MFKKLFDAQGNFSSPFKSVHCDSANAAQGSYLYRLLLRKTVMSIHRTQFVRFLLYFWRLLYVTNVFFVKHCQGQIQNVNKEFDIHCYLNVAVVAKQYKLSDYFHLVVAVTLIKIEIWNWHTFLKKCYRCICWRKTSYSKLAAKSS